MPISAFQNQQQQSPFNQPSNPNDLAALQNAFLGATAQPNIRAASLGAGGGLNPNTNPFGFLSNVFAGDLAQRQNQQAAESLAGINAAKANAAFNQQGFDNNIKSENLLSANNKVAAGQNKIASDKRDKLKVISDKGASIREALSLSKDKKAASLLKLSDSALGRVPAAVLNKIGGLTGKSVGEQVGDILSSKKRDELIFKKVDRASVKVEATQPVVDTINDILDLTINPDGTAKAG
ncbi:MAG: hypothetical protein R8K20_01010, partial [Gallionellaceae bacterium]